MREVSVPATTTVADDENLTDMVWANAERFATAVAFRKPIEGTWVDVTAQEFAAQVLAVAKGFLAAGLRPGDRIGLLSRTRYEWTLVDYAIWSAGCVTVPIYETSSAEQVRWIVTDSGARAVVVETAEHRDRLPAVDLVWQLDDAAGASAVDELTALGADLPDTDVHERRRAVRADDIATLIYTSGTTGRPKGCELSHRNLLAEIRADVAAFPDLMTPSTSLLMFLPLAHVLARAITCTAVYARTTLGHSPDVRNLVPDLGSFRPSSVLAVPRVFEKVYNSAKQQAHADGKGRIFDAAEAVAVEYSEARDHGGPNLSLRLKHALFDRLVYSRLRMALGGRCVAAVSGGAPLGDRLAHFFRGVGLPVYEGYGLTETTAAACVNVAGAAKIGTVGRPVSGTAVRIADDGEILIKGDVVFPSYWQNPAATAAALTDGWFHTGDLGALDDDGFLSITGRKKEIIVTAGGKNVAPAQLEDRLRAHPLISQAMVVGDQQPFIAALITIDEEFLGTWKSRHGKETQATVADLADDPDLLAEIQSAVDEANRSVSKAESIRKFRVLPTDFAELSGELTPSLKIRRTIITNTRSSAITALYS